MHDIKPENKKKILNVKDSICMMLHNVNKRDINFYIDLANELSSNDIDNYIGCELNRIGDLMVIVERKGIIYLFSNSYQTIMYAPKLMFHYVDSSHIHIDDILVKHNNVGNGSILMRALFKLAQHNGVTTITGYLSNVDNDHKDRRNHYYEKFGFTIESHRITKILEVKEYV